MQELQSLLNCTRLKSILGKLQMVMWRQLIAEFLLIRQAFNKLETGIQHTGAPRNDKHLPTSHPTILLWCLQFALLLTLCFLWHNIMNTKVAVCVKNQENMWQYSENSCSRWNWLNFKVQRDLLLWNPSSIKVEGGSNGDTFYPPMQPVDRPNFQTLWYAFMKWIEQFKKLEWVGEHSGWRNQTIHYCLYKGQWVSKGSGPHCITGPWGVVSPVMKGKERLQGCWNYHNRRGQAQPEGGPYSEAFGGNSCWRIFSSSGLFPGRGRGRVGVACFWGPSELTHWYCWGLI